MSKTPSERIAEAIDMGWQPGDRIIEPFKTIGYLITIPFEHADGRVWYMAYTVGTDPYPQRVSHLYSKELLKKETGQWKAFFNNRPTPLDALRRAGLSKAAAQAYLDALPSDYFRGLIALKPSEELRREVAALKKNDDDNLIVTVNAGNVHGSKD